MEAKGSGGESDSDTEKPPVEVDLQIDENHPLVMFVQLLLNLHQLQHFPNAYQIYIKKILNCTNNLAIVTTSNAFTLHRHLTATG